MSSLENIAAGISGYGIDLSDVQNSTLGEVNMSVIIWMSVFSLFGFVYWGYGRKQQNDVAFYSGITLMIYPYFVYNLYYLIPIGIILIILPFIIKDY